jgi:uncharacterized protein (TIGR03067 family)
MKLTPRVRCFAALPLATLLLLTSCSRSLDSKSADATSDPTSNGINTSPATTVSAAAADKPDAEALLGSWRLVDVYINGKVNPNLTGKEVKLVFSKDSLHFLFGLNNYQIDPTQNPKHLDFQDRAGAGHSLGLKFKAIYKLEEDTLTICYVDAQVAKRPTSFTTSLHDLSQTIVCERLKSISNQPDREDLDLTLKATIDEAVVLLEANEMEKLLERILPEHQWQRMKQAPKEELDTIFASVRQPFLNTFRVLPKIRPKMTGDAEALFDLAHVHIEGGLFNPLLKFVKVNGQWRMADR